MIHKYEVEVPKGLGDIFGNCIRQGLYVLTYGWTPVAFQLGDTDEDTTTILKSRLDTTSDMISVLSVINKNKYSLNSDNNKLAVIKYKFKGQLKVSDLNNNGVSVSYDRDDIVVDMIDKSKEVTLTIVFSYHNRILSAEEIRYRMEVEGLKANRFAVFPTGVDVFDYIKVNVCNKLNTDMVNLEINTFFDREEELIEPVINKYIDCFKSIRKI